MPIYPLIFAIGIIANFGCAIPTEKRLPSATNIEEYDDPLLDEIFADTNSDSKILPQKQINTAATLVNSQANSAAIMAAKQQHQQSSIFSGELERMSSAPSSSAAAAAVAEGTKNVIDPNAKPLPGSVFTNPGMNPFPNILSKLGAHSDGTASAGPTLGLDSQNNGAAAFAGPLTDWAFQAGQTFYTGVRQAGHLFGIDAGQYQQYEIPLISQGARFFGRRRR